MGIFYETNNHEIEGDSAYHEPEWKPTGDDGEMTQDNDDIPGTVPADTPSSKESKAPLGEFSSIFYEGDCAGSNCNTSGAGSSQTSKPEKPVKPEKMKPEKPVKPEKMKPEKPMKESALGFDII